MKPVRITDQSLRTLKLERYTFEKKYDGHRAVVVQDRSGIRLWTRQKEPIRISPKFELELASLRLEAGTVLDAEIWNPLKRGGWANDSEAPCMLSIWDCIWNGKNDLSSAPIEDRRKNLKEIIRNGTDHIRMVEVFDAEETIIREIEKEARDFRQSEAVRSGYIHGVVLKRKRSPRRDHATRSMEHPDWLKLLFCGMKGWEPS